MNTKDSARELLGLDKVNLVDFVEAEQLAGVFFRTGHTVSLSAKVQLVVSVVAKVATGSVGWSTGLE